MVDGAVDLAGCTSGCSSGRAGVSRLRKSWSEFETDRASRKERESGESGAMAREGFDPLGGTGQGSQVNKYSRALADGSLGGTGQGSHGPWG